MHGTGFWRLSVTRRKSFWEAFDELARIPPFFIDILDGLGSIICFLFVIVDFFFCSRYLGQYLGFDEFLCRWEGTHVFLCPLVFLPSCILLRRLSALPLLVSLFVALAVDGVGFWSALCLHFLSSPLTTLLLLYEIDLLSQRYHGLVVDSDS